MNRNSSLKILFRLSLTLAAGLQVFSDTVDFSLQMDALSKELFDLIFH